MVLNALGLASDLLDVGLCLGKDGQDEGGCLIWTEGGRHNQVLARLEQKELHHFTCIHVGFRLGYRVIFAEERGVELPPLCLVLLYR